MQHSFAVAGATLLLFATGVEAQSVAQRQLRPLTVADSLQLKRLLTGQSDLPVADSRNGAISFSPDGEAYLLRVAWDDLAQDMSYVDFYVGKTVSLASAVPMMTALRTPPNRTASVAVTAQLLTPNPLEGRVTRQW